MLCCSTVSDVCSLVCAAPYAQVSDGGDCLVYMASNPALENVTGVFFNNELVGYGEHRFKVTEPSDEAQDDREAKRLWALSEKLVGLSA